MGVVPKTVEGTSLPDYVKYIFNFAIIIAGAVAFGVTVLGGIRWLTSAGDPSKLRDAKDQIFAAFLGLIILLSSYLILTTINPQLVLFEAPGLKTVEVLPSPPPTKDVSPNPLVRIKELAQTIDGISSGLKNEGEALKTELEKCQCQNSNSECYCSGLSCRAKRCFGDPCKNLEEIKISLSGEEIIIAPGELREEIKIKQRGVIAKTDEVLYYRNRVSSEKEDISSELARFIYLGILTEAESNDLTKNLEELIVSLKNIAIVSEGFAEVPNNCLPDSCVAHCQQDTCHHTCSPCGSAMIFAAPYNVLEPLALLLMTASKRLRTFRQKFPKSAKIL